MSGSAPTIRQAEKALKALNGRAKRILKARPAYREMADFYLTVFRRQIEWREKLAVHPETVDDDQWRQCREQGKPLIELCDPGIESASLLELWTEMKTVFSRGNDVLRQAVEQIDEAERSVSFTPATWLAEQRPDRFALVAEAARQIGVEESVLASLARAVTFPHWQVVAESWLTEERRDAWQRFCCQVCGGTPGLAEIRAEAGSDPNLKPGARRFMHCPFCSARWVVPGLTCPACGSTKSGDAKYYYSPDETDVRIDFCKSCNHYVKVVKADGGTPRLHVGLELLTTAHLDQIAQEKDLNPLESCA